MFTFDDAIVDYDTDETLIVQIHNSLLVQISAAKVFLDSHKSRLDRSALYFHVLGGADAWDLASFQLARNQNS